MLDQQPVTICGIGAVFSSDAQNERNNHAGAVVEWLLENATRDGANLALLFRTATTTSPVTDDFEVVPTIDAELTVAESSRRGDSGMAAACLRPSAGHDGVGAAGCFGRVRAGPFSPLPATSPVQL